MIGLVRAATLCATLALGLVTAQAADPFGPPAPPRCAAAGGRFRVEGSANAKCCMRLFRRPVPPP